MTETEFGDLRFTRPLNQQLKLLDDIRKILRVDEIEGDLTVELVLGVSKQPLERRAFKSNRSNWIEHGDNLRRIFDQVAEVVLALLQRHLRPFLLCDVQRTADQ